MTYTVARMEVSPSTFAEIRRKLEEASYDHAIHVFEDAPTMLDMTHIALIEEEAVDEPLPYVGQIVHYYNPDYKPDANFEVGVGPYAAVVTKVYDPFVSLGVFTHGKAEIFHIASVPRRGSEHDDGKFPAWEPIP